MAWKQLLIWLCLISSLTHFPPTYACEQTSVREYLVTLELMSNMAKRAHQFVNELQTQQGIDAIILAYPNTRFIDLFHQQLTEFRPEILARKKQAFIEYNVCRGHSTAQIDKQYGKLFVEVDKEIKQLLQYDVQFQAKTLQDKFTRFRHYAIKMFGDPEKKGVLRAYYEERQWFDRFLPQIRRADIYDLWSLYQAKGPYYFHEYTGIDLDKGCTAHVKEHNPSCRIFSMSDFGNLLTGHVSDGLPYDIDIPNRSYLALKMLGKDADHQAVNEWISAYSHRVATFRSEAAERYGIRDWRKVPEGEHDMLWTLRHWSVSQYQRMLKRIDVVNKVIDPKAEEDWERLKQMISVGKDAP